MKTTTNSNRMLGFVDLYNLHTDYFVRALKGISDNDTHNRLGTKANHIGWIAGSNVHERFEMAKLFGSNEKCSHAELFANNKGIQDDVTYPSLEEYKTEWHRISPVLKEIYVTLSDDKLDEEFEMMPGMNSTYYELITYMIYREANMIGQLALYRRLLGYEGINYM